MKKYSPFGKEIALLLLEQGDRVRDLAVKIGVSRTYMSSVMSAKMHHNPSRKLIDKIINVYNLDSTEAIRLWEARDRSLGHVEILVDGLSDEYKELAILLRQKLNQLLPSQIQAIQRILHQRNRETHQIKEN